MTRSKLASARNLARMGLDALAFEAHESLIQRAVLVTELLSNRRLFRLGLLQIRVDALLMTEIIGNSAIDLLEREDRKGLHDRFRRITLPEAPDDGVKSHPRPCHPVHIVVVFYIRALLHGYRPSQCGHLSIRVSSHYT